MEKKKKADILLERILLMIDIYSELSTEHISFALHRKEIAQEAYNQKNTIGLGMLQRQLLGSWEAGKKVKTLNSNKPYLTNIKNRLAEMPLRISEEIKAFWQKSQSEKRLSMIWSMILSTIICQTI
ncbi:hypothetical protein [Xanthocytophaga flava]|uniref:hypothetical protein n=1 Tax=Xanthocytophaga flava TaxID=3048013 RepID=UPI0028D3F316|nr:hypothetical protein [Xanthocytophaga flavus]MDJ1471115.1 hypothetical protein [Xanthocytophaga flavus]